MYSILILLDKFILNWYNKNTYIYEIMKLNYSLVILININNIKLLTGVWNGTTKFIRNN